MIGTDRVILDVDDPDWAAVHGLARDFRSCTKTIAVGPTLFAAHGPAALRSLQELQFKVIVNICMCMQAPRMLQTLYQLLTMPGVIAVSIMATDDVEQLTTIVDSAEQARLASHRVEFPRILAHVYSRSKQRRRDIRKQTMACQLAGITEIITVAADLEAAQSVAKSKLAVLSTAERPPRDYRSKSRAEMLGKPGITELLANGASQVLLESSLLRRTDTEWVADMAIKEVTTWEQTALRKSAM